MIGIDQGRRAKVEGGHLKWCATDREGEGIRVSAAPSLEVLVRTLTLDVTKPRQIAKVLPFQIEPLLPLPLDELSWDYVVRKIEDGKAYVTLFATPYKGEESERISCIADALAKATPGDGAAVHVGDVITCCLIQHGEVLAAHAFEDVGAIEQTLKALSAKHKFAYEKVYVAGECDVVGEKLGDYAIAIGLAKSTINLRKKAPFPWRRMKKQLAVYALSLATLCGASLMLSELILARKHAAVQAEYASLEALAGKPHAELTKLPAEIILAKAAKIDRELQAVPANYPLVADVPSIKEVIAWIATLPIEVEELRYQMVRYPSKSRPNEHYRTRVELTFTTDSPTVAREVHEQLTREVDLIGSPIEWSAKSDRYVAAFDLKDRTRYL